MKELKKRFPPGHGLRHRARHHALRPRKHQGPDQDAAHRGISLVALVVLVFLQSWRASLVPILAIPVSLVGTFAVMWLVGFSLNMLTLFGLVLAIGIVVDDAIVVVENVQRLLEGLSPRDAAFKAMDEVAGRDLDRVGLSAVFIPVAFIPGITGRFYQQFALTIAFSTLLSAFISLTLSPRLPRRSSLRTRRSDRLRRGTCSARLAEDSTGVFNRGFDRLSHCYGSAAELRDPASRGDAADLCCTDRKRRLAACTTPRLHPCAGPWLRYLSAQLPGAASLARTAEIVRQDREPH